MHDNYNDNNEDFEKVRNIENLNLDQLNEMYTKIKKQLIKDYAKLTLLFPSLMVTTLPMFNFILRKELNYDIIPAIIAFPIILHYIVVYIEDSSKKDELLNNIRKKTKCKELTLKKDLKQL